MKFELTDENDGNGNGNNTGNRKIIEIEGFAPECQPDDSTPGICGDINKNSYSFFFSFLFDVAA